MTSTSARRWSRSWRHRRSRERQGKGNHVDYRNTRREFLRDLGIGAAALPFVLNLPSLAAADPQRRKQRLIVMFSPDGVVPPAFWPDEEGAAFTLKESLK